MTPPRFSTRPWRGKVRYGCRLCGFGTLDRGTMVRHVVDQHPTPSEGAAVQDALSGIPFASPEARVAADAGGLQGPALLRATSPSSRRGYTVRDVRHALRTTTTATQET